MRHTRTSRRRQAAAYGCVALVALGLTGALLPASRPAFDRFLGGLHPVVAVGVAGVAGAVALSWLQRGHRLVVIAGTPTRHGVSVAMASAGMFGAAAVVADWILRYPADLNVAWPRSVAFYAAMGFVAETVFHVVPLALVLLASRPLSNRLDEGLVMAASLSLTAVVEPTVQLVLADEPLSWTGLHTGVHVLALNAVQLRVFHRYDFVSMLVLRLTYYLVWHVAWGAVRLHLLF